MEGMCRIGAYLKVFHEGTNFNWETRNLKYKEKMGRKTFTYLVSSNFPFAFVNMAVFILYLQRTQWNEDFDSYEVFKLIIAVRAFIMVSILIFKNRSIATSDFVEKWEEIDEINKCGLDQGGKIL